jgi:hypothetical protein
MDKCPVCGYKENVNTVLQSNHMNNYAYADGPNAGKPYGTLNSGERTVTIPANSNKNIPAIRIFRSDIFTSYKDAQLEFDRQVDKQQSADKFERQVGEALAQADNVVGIDAANRAAAAQNVVAQSNVHASETVNKANATIANPSPKKDVVGTGDYKNPVVAINPVITSPTGKLATPPQTPVQTPTTQSAKTTTPSK